MTSRFESTEQLAETLRSNPDLAKANLKTTPEPSPEGTALARQGLNPKGGNADRATSKYHAQRTNGYASKKEAQYAADLELRQKAGEVWFWLEQVPFILPGGTKHRVDFMVFYVFYDRQEWELIEIKGRDLPMGRMKRKMVEDLYSVTITVV